MAAKEDSEVQHQGAVPAPASSAMDIEKQSSAHQEYSATEVLEKEENRADADYSGAVAKTDPAEIQLVKKLDLFLMPTLWIMVSEP